MVRLDFYLIKSFTYKGAIKCSSLLCFCYSWIKGAVTHRNEVLCGNIPLTHANSLWLVCMASPTRGEAKIQILAVCAYSSLWER